MATSTVIHEGQTYTFKGRAMTHAVITTLDDRKPLVEFAGSLAKATKNADARDSRVEKVRRGEQLQGCYSTEWHRHVVETVIVPVSIG